MAHGYPKVLYFIAGMAPTPDQIADADNCGPGVAFRNATLIHPDAPIEDCDAVAGDAIPDNYADALPNISDREAVKQRMVNRNPVLAGSMGVQPQNTFGNETEGERTARINNALARGQRQPGVNERGADQPIASQRTTQAGTPRVEWGSGNGWSTGAAANPETVNDAAAKGQGLGAVEGDAGEVGAVPVGASGRG
jgi:hypothetical protein